MSITTVIKYKVQNLGKSINPMLIANAESPEQALEFFLLEMRKKYPTAEGYKTYVGDHFTVEKIYVTV